MPLSISNYLENKFFLGIPLLLLASSVASWSLRTHLHLHNPRLQYGVWHLPAALLLAALFAAVAGLLLKALSRSSSIEDKPTSYYLIALVIAFCLCWLPVLLAGRFVQDDWMLLAAASIRKIIYLHPGYAWFSLDTVDGNFRPLGTTLYFAYMLKLFGAHAFAFLCGNFIINLCGSLVAFFIVRELGYSKMAGAAASILYMTRGMNYTAVAWACALGDGIVILLGGLTVLGILRANKRSGLSAFAYHVLAWMLFCIATFAKQSSFSIPFIVMLLVLIRPGEAALPPLQRRVKQALLALIVYSIPAAVIFVHAKMLLQHKTPYPMSINLDSFTQWLSFVAWYFVGVGFGGKYKIYDLLGILTKCMGAAILLGLIAFVKKVPRALGKRPRDIAFLLLAALAAIAPYALIPTRTAIYYGAMSAFWISIAFGIVLTQFGGITDKSPAARNAYFALYLLVIAGALEIRLKQTGGIPSGGYIWGTYGMDEQKNTYDQLAEILARVPTKDTIVMVDFPGDGRYYTSMAMFADPGLQRILIYNTKAGTYMVNDLVGLRPKDEFGALNDVQSYNWTLPIESTQAEKIVGQDRVAWIKFDNEKIYPVASVVKSEVN